MVNTDRSTIRNLSPSLTSKAKPWAAGTMCVFIDGSVRGAVMTVRMPCMMVVITTGNNTTHGKLGQHEQVIWYGMDHMVTTCMVREGSGPFPISRAVCT